MFVKAGKEGHQPGSPSRAMTAKRPESDVVRLRIHPESGHRLPAMPPIVAAWKLAGRTC